MDDAARRQAFVSALAAEHFVLQAGADAATAEMGARSAPCLGVLGSALVALGFATPSRAVFVPFVATVLPAVFVLGLVTGAPGPTVRGSGTASRGRADAPTQRARGGHRGRWAGSGPQQAGQRSLPSVAS